MRLSTGGAHLIEGFEGFSSVPYQDSVGVWTIGYGTTLGIGPRSHPVTRAAAEAMLINDVDLRFGKAVDGLRLPLNQNQFDALVSFVYNVGPGGVGETSTVGKRLRAHDWRAAADAMLAWDRAGGHVLEGLRRRRIAERALFLTTPTNLLAGYTASEVRWIREYDKLRRDGRDQDRQRVLRRVMTAQRKRIWRAAAATPNGWDYANRRARYRSLLARTR